MPSLKPKSFLITLLLFFCSACTADMPPLPTYVPSPFPAASAAPTAEMSLPASTAPAPAGCSLAEQTAALREGGAFDWEILGELTCYRLALRLQPELPGYSGSAAVHFTNQTGSSLDELVFRLYPNADGIYGGELSVTGISVAGKAVVGDVFLADQTALRLPLPASLAPGESIVVEMDFTGRLTNGLPANNRAYGLFTLHPGEQTLILANSFPLLAPWREDGWVTYEIDPLGDAVLSDTAIFDVEVTSPPEWQTAASGVMVSEAMQDGLIVRRFASGPVRDFMLAAGSNFSLIEGEINGITVRHWGLPLGKTRWQEGLQAALDALAVFEETYGLYPYTELDVVAAPLQMASGVEFPGLFLMSNELYDPEAESPFLLDLVIAHETAHQWWYGVVGSDPINYPWQDEALTTFSSLLYLQQYQTRYYQGTLDFYRSRGEEALRTSVNAAISQPVSAFDERPQEYSPIVYSRGAVFLDGLRLEIGDEAFFQALRSYYRDNLWEIAEPENLLAQFEHACACALDSFYGEWGVR